MTSKHFLMAKSTKRKLKEFIHYEPETGRVFWARDSEHRKMKGKAFGTRMDGGGYLVLRFQGHTVKVHRLAFLIMKGRWPLIVDHINRNREDNRWENLREVNVFQSMQNREAFGRVKFRGVSLFTYPTGTRRFRARVTCDGTTHEIGLFRTPIEAAQAYDLKAREIFGEHAALNFP